MGGGQGASSRKDGKSALLWPTSTANSSVELFETRVPVLVLEKGYVTESGGGGIEASSEPASACKGFTMTVWRRCSQFTRKALTSSSADCSADSQDRGHQASSAISIEASSMIAAPANWSRSN